MDDVGLASGLPALPPIVAGVTVILWWARPQLRRNVGYRLALIASVSLTALEGMLLAVFAVVLFFFYLSGGMRDF